MGRFRTEESVIPKSTYPMRPILPRGGHHTKIDLSCKASDRGYRPILPRGRHHTKISPSYKASDRKHIHFGNERHSPKSGWGRHFPKMTFPKIRTGREGQDRTGQQK